MRLGLPADYSACPSFNPTIALESLVDHPEDSFKVDTPSGLSYQQPSAYRINHNFDDLLQRLQSGIAHFAANLSKSIQHGTKEGQES